MLFSPQFDQACGQEASDCRQVVQPGMAGGAHYNQPGGGVIPRAAMVHVEPIRGGAHPATMPVPIEHRFPRAGKPLPGMGVGPIAAPAQSGQDRNITARAEQGLLAIRSPGWDEPAV